MGPLAKRKPGQLSKGQAQKVQFAMALLGGPSFLILDEPFSGFDPLASADIQAIIAEQHKKGTTLLMATHRLETAEALCSHTALLHQGRILQAGRTQALLENERGPQALRRYFLAQLKAA
jgi:ABC-2 type transport system ATP-binding protein